jgi:hypothetical protein
MDNRDLVKWSQRLYQAIVDANLPTQQLRDVASAIRARKPWADLSPDVKLAVMKMAVRCQPGNDDPKRVIDLQPPALNAERANDNDDNDGASEGEGNEPRVA